MNHRDTVNLISNIDPEKFRIFLQDDLINRCKQNPSYSLRAYARDLQIDNSALSKLLSGKRKLGKNIIRKLVEKLDLDTDSFEFFLNNMDADLSEVEIEYKQLAIDSFAIISDWHHYAILELLRVDQFQPNVDWISKSLGMKSFEVKVALERLLRVGLIKFDSKQNIIDISGGKTTNISDEMSHSALRKMQKQLLEKSIQCLEDVEYEKRSHTSMTMAIDTEKLTEAVEEIKKFRRKMGKLLSRGHKRDQVYNLSIALCPLSNIKIEREH